MLAAARQSASAEKDTPDAADFDWSAPRHFTGEQLETLNEVAAAGAEGISRALTKLLQMTVQVQAQLATQHYGPDLQDASQETDCWASVVDDAGNLIGLLVLPASLAARWVARLLGGIDSDVVEDRELSALESTLLADILTAMGKAL